MFPEVKSGIVKFLNDLSKKSQEMHESTLSNKINNIKKNKMSFNNYNFLKSSPKKIEEIEKHNEDVEIIKEYEKQLQLSNFSNNEMFHKSSKVQIIKTHFEPGALLEQSIYVKADVSSKTDASKRAADIHDSKNSKSQNLYLSNKREENVLNFFNTKPVKSRNQHSDLVRVNKNFNTQKNNQIKLTNKLNTSSIEKRNQGLSKIKNPLQTSTGYKRYSNALMTELMTNSIFNLTNMNCTPNKLTENNSDMQNVYRQCGRSLSNFDNIPKNVITIVHKGKKSKETLILNNQLLIIDEDNLDNKDIKTQQLNENYTNDKLKDLIKLNSEEDNKQKEIKIEYRTYQSSFPGKTYTNTTKDSIFTTGFYNHTKKNNQMALLFNKDFQMVMYDSGSFNLPLVSTQDQSTQNQKNKYTSLISI